MFASIAISVCTVVRSVCAPITLITDNIYMLKDTVDLREINEGLSSCWSERIARSVKRVNHSVVHQSGGNCCTSSVANAAPCQE